MNAFQALRHSLKLETAPVEAPVTLGDTKNYCRIETLADDTLLAGLINTAANTIEFKTGRALMAQTWFFGLEAFPAEIRLPRSPVTAINTFDYIDHEGNPGSVDPADFQWTDSQAPVRLRPAYGKTWPTARQQFDSVSIKFDAGYAAIGETPDDQRAAIPEALKTAILQLVLHMYENREPVITGTIVSEIPMTVEYLIDDYVVYGTTHQLWPDGIYR